MIPKILTAAYQTSRPDILDTEEVTVSKYHTLLHCRHDLIHYLINETLCLPNTFGRNDLLEKEFGDFMPDQLLKYSPDIVYINNNSCIIADISCTWNKEFHLNEKKQKYDMIVECLRSETSLIVPDLYLVWMDPAWSNFEDCLEQWYSHLSKCSVSFTKVPQVVSSEVKTLYEDLAEDIEKIKRSIPTELIHDDRTVQASIREIDKPLLESLSSSKFKHYSKIKKTILSSSQDEVETIFESLVNDHEVIDVLKDERHDETMFEKAFSNLDKIEKNYPIGPVKPSFFVPFADFSPSISEMLGNINHNDEIGELRFEQNQVMTLLKFLTTCNSFTDNSVKQSLCKIYRETKVALKMTADLNLFNTGYITGKVETESELNKSYTEYRRQHDSSVSKRSYFKNFMGNDTKMRDLLPYVYKNKCIKVSSAGLSSDWFSKSGTAYRKTHEARHYKTKTTISEEHSNSFQEFMSLLNEPDDKPYRTHPFLGTEAGPDVPFAENVKRGFLEKQIEFLSLIQRTKAHSFSQHATTIVSQLLHFNELNTSPNTFYMMTGGRQNVLHIVRGGSLKRGEDVGQSFFTIFITHDSRWASSVYGQIKTFPVDINDQKCFICVTPWVRLSSTKLSFMKDQYFSTLSTAYDSWTRIRDRTISRQTIQMIYTYRVCVSLSPSQKVAELLMDTRYIVMAALSTYSNVYELIVDKFKPPYKNCFEKFIVQQLRKKCGQIVVHFRNSPPKPNKPGFSLNTRLQSTLGGSFSMPSLWSEEIVTSMQGLFDDLFVYVHTSKEPSSDYHEQVRAMNTILKFQKSYDALEDSMQSGLASVDGLKHWLLSGEHIGCHASTVYWGTKLWSKKFNNLYKSTDFKESCLTEPLSELESTKSCIPEVSRAVCIEERTKSEMDQVINNLGQLYKTDKQKPREPLKKYFKLDVNMGEDVEMVITKSLRVKVHDSLLDWMKRSGSRAQYTLDLALWNLKENNMRVIADTCIKAQYGAKREFYVINLGAKGMARVLENTYKCLAKHCRNEMISVPGDRKLEFIQSSVNEVILSSERRQDKIFYTNGDCTKWSACETMSSFISFNTGLSDVFGEDMTSFNNSVFSSWANKEIQIPQSILQNLKHMSDQTEYITDTTTISSTQNFLQGMFNYASSLKAVAASEFALHMFRKLNPDSFIVCTHLEHSDDYSLVTRVRDDAVFEKFRVYHKLSQKLFGINDSIKKTNVQKHFLEFISLFSFNGQLYYPNIKKTKEVGTNLPCTNFKNDVMAITSRVAEAVRLGVPMESCYFLQRVHSASLANAYSLTPGMKNAYGCIKDCFSMPLETFGFPDCLPVFHYMVRGNPESYRLYNYGGENVQNLYKKLFKLSQTNHENEDLPLISFEEDLGEFYTAEFSYPTRHNRLKEIKKKLNISLELSREYFDKNLTDTLVKPAESARFQEWLEAMYYNKSFSKAYMSVSRATMTLRHSMFSSKPCIMPFDRKRLELDPNENIEFWTVNQSIQAFNNLSLTSEERRKLEKSDIFKQSICSYDPSLSMLYDFLETSKLIQDSTIDTHTTVSRAPAPYQDIVLENRVQLLLQFLINPENFYSDRRKFLSETSLYRDIEKLSQYYNIPLLKKDMGYARQVMKELVSQLPPSSYGLVFDTQDKSSLGYLRQYISYGLFSGETFRFVPCERTEVVVGSQTKIKFARDWKTNTDTFTEVLYQLALIYRAIQLRDVGNFQRNIELLLQYFVPELGVSVVEFLKAVDISKLLSYKVGDNAQKVLAFLKMKLLSDHSDMRSYLTGKLFYEVNYMSRNTCPDGFDEWCTLRFQNKSCNAYLKRGTTQKPLIILEMQSVNKVMWFYFYTIAERAFGTISQQKFDLRMLHTFDMSIPKLGQDQEKFLELLMLRDREPQVFSMNGKVIQQVLNTNQANLPVLIQQGNFSYAKFGHKETMNSISLYTIEGLSVYMGSILMYTLPFGNLHCKNMLAIPDESKEIKLDSLPLSLLQEGSRLSSYLKSDFSATYSIEEIDRNLANLWKNKEPEIKKCYKIKNLGSQFDLDFLTKPAESWVEKKDQSLQDLETEDLGLDINDPLKTVPGIKFTRSSISLSKTDQFKTQPLIMDADDLNPIVKHDTQGDMGSLAISSGIKLGSFGLMHQGDKSSETKTGLEKKDNFPSVKVGLGKSNLPISFPTTKVKGIAQETAEESEILSSSESKPMIKLGSSFSFKKPSLSQLKVGSAAHDEDSDDEDKLAFFMQQEFGDYTPSRTEVNAHSDLSSENDDNHDDALFLLQQEFGGLQEDEAIFGEDEEEKAPEPIQVRTPVLKIGAMPKLNLTIPKLMPETISSVAGEDSINEESFFIQQEMSQEGISNAEPEERDELEEERRSKEKLLSMVKLKSTFTPVEDDDGNMDDKMSLMFSKYGLVGHSSSAESKEKAQSIKDLVKSVSESDNFRIESIRNQITLGNLMEEEIGELFETGAADIVEDAEWSSTSSEGALNENPGYFQMVEHPALLETGYQFERRAREATLDLNDYLFNCWLEPDLEQICNDSQNLGNLLRLLSGILTNKDRLDLTKKKKALIKSTILGLKKKLSSTIYPYMFSQSKAITVKDDKFEFLAIAGYTSKSRRDAVVSKKPSISSLPGIENHTTTSFWAKANMKQSDLSIFLDFSEKPLVMKTNSRIGIMLEKLIPEIEEVKLDLCEDYGF